MRVLSCLKALSREESNILVPNLFSAKSTEQIEGAVDHSVLQVMRFFRDADNRVQNPLTRSINQKAEMDPIQ